jgi:ADP-ribosylglycohydrolase
VSLTAAQADRAAGVLLGQACGDALGVPYEFGRPPGPGDLAEMRGGGLGGFAPGEWSDDTAMAVAVAEGLGTAPGEQGLDEVAARFLAWYAGGPADVGIQTSVVLAETSRRLGDRREPPAKVMTDAAAAYVRAHERAAGNGALMRTSPVALFHLQDRDGCAVTARAVAELTHADPLCGDSSVLWSEAIRVAVLVGRLDVESGLDLLPEERRDAWAGWLAEAVAGPPARFTGNGFTVTALQAAYAAIAHTPVPDGPAPCLHLQDALHAAVRIGHDTDTVAAIAGGLLGARWGASAVPWRWRRTVHGWPGRTGRDLVCIGAGMAPGSWPDVDDLRYVEQVAAGVVPHPDDPGVLLGTHASRGHGADAVVSLCRVGRRQGCFDGAVLVVESRLVDDDDPSVNPNLAFALYDAADAVRGLRAEGHTVLLHCVAAEQRTPSVAAAYAVLRGSSADAARDAVRAALPGARGRGALWAAVDQVAATAELARHRTKEDA